MGIDVRRCGALAAGMMSVFLACRADAQTDYYNTDRNRPVRVEDAYATERYAFEVKLAPVRVARGSGGSYHWGIDPEVAYGILPRTHVEFGLPYAVIEREGETHSGVAGIELSAFHNLNVETALPAFALRADVLLPVGRLSPEKVYPAVTGIATRTYGWARFHLNVQYSPAASTASITDPAVGATGDELSRWLAGIAVDRTIPLRAVLLTAEVYARRPLNEESVEWNAGAGSRYQVSPYLAVDAGVGRQLTGHREWHVTFGTAVAFGLRRLIPVAALGDAAETAYAAREWENR